MATFVRGNAIPNATAYKLLKKNSDGTYTEIATKNISNGSLNYEYAGRLDSDGDIVADGSVYIWKRSEFINIEDLENGSDGWCVWVENTSQNAVEIKAEFYEPSGYNGKNCVGYIRYEGKEGTPLTAEEIKSIAANFPTAKWIVFYLDFSSPDAKDIIHVTTSINFALDNYKDKLAAGENHLLVVQAIGEGGVDTDGDGVIWKDSEYCLGEDGNPLTYTA